MLVTVLWASCALVLCVATASTRNNCRFAVDYSCDDFSTEARIWSYLHDVMHWEAKFASAGIGYDAATGYTYDGHPLDYQTGDLFGEPHLFSAPSKESIHVSMLALAVSGNEHALQFVGGTVADAVRLLQLKMQGYLRFNATYPAYGCFTPWVGFEDQTIKPISGWDDPYRVPGLDNGEWFWSLYAATVALEERGAEYSWLAAQYRAYVDCQRRNARTIFYRGYGLVSAVVTIEDPFDAAKLSDPNNYAHSGSDGGGYLDDPYEGETMTMLLYLFDDSLSDAQRQELWNVKRAKLQPAFFDAGDGSSSGSKVLTVQKGFWFSTHEQWKTLLLPYLSVDIVRHLFSNAEKVRVLDASRKGQPGLYASVNDVTDGSQQIPDYISAAGVDSSSTSLGSIAFQEIQRTDVFTPYASFGLMLHNISAGLCWYNNLLQAPRMQSAFGSTEGINANGTEISPITTWDSKVTTVLAMLGGVGDVVARGLLSEPAGMTTDETAHTSFVRIVTEEHVRAFAAALGTDSGHEVEYSLPSAAVTTDHLSDWQLNCPR